MSNRVLLVLVFMGLTVPAFAQSNFHRFNFNVGGGLGIGKQDVARFVGASYNGVAGAGYSFSRRFGVNAEYMYYGLPFKPSVISKQFLLPGAGGRVQSASLDGIVNLPMFGRWRTYGIFGVGFYWRSVSNHTEPVLAGTPCQPAWRWWDLTCTTGPGIPVVAFNQTIASNTKDAGGVNFGGGLTHPLNHLHHAKFYAEGRYHRAYHSDGETIFIPITVGLRW